MRIIFMNTSHALIGTCLQSKQQESPKGQNDELETGIEPAFTAFQRQRHLSSWANERFTTKHFLSKTNLHLKSMKFRTNSHNHLQSVLVLTTLFLLFLT